jgi:Periplasmic binding protein
MSRCAPYLYNYPMASEEIFARIGDWSCAQLVGRKARWAGPSAGDAGLGASASNRNFGIFLAPYTSDDPVARRSALDGLVERLRQCGAEVPESQIIINPVGATSPGVSVDPASANNAVVQMKQAKVSTVICLCATFPFGALARAASTNDYRPEWIGSSFGGLDQVVILQLAAAPAEQLQRLFGLTFAPRQINPLLEPYNAAFQEGDPAMGPKTASTDYSNFTQVYRPLLMLVSGLQMAGPNLTPQTFLEGLRKTRFPNPITSINAGAVGLPPDGFTFTADAAQWWWSNTANGPYTDDAAGKGAICYVDGGARHDLGTWPAAEPNVFAGSCDAG